MMLKNSPPSAMQNLDSSRVTQLANEPPTELENKLPRYALGALLLLLVLLWFGSLDYRRLIHPDEGRYAEIPREMVATGDWLTPRLNGYRYFEKPPLQYWATATAFKLFGEHEWTVRLWPALTGFLGILFTGYATAVLYGRRAGWYAAAVLASSILYGAIGRVATLDMGLTFFLTVALFAFALAQRDGASARARQNWMWAVWAALALAMLSKGLVALLLPAVTLVLYILWQRDGTLLRRMYWLSGLSIFFLIAAPWFIAVSVANPGFAQFFFIHEHFERFTSKVHGRYEPPWYFLPVLLAGIIPWLGALIQTLRAAKARTSGHFQSQRFLLLWSVVVFFFFSMSGSKLLSYILPMFPSVAALMGGYFASQKQTPAIRALRWQALPWVVLGLAGWIIAPNVLLFASPDVPQLLYTNYIPWLVAASVVLMCAGIIAYWQAARGSTTGFVLALTVGGMLTLLLALDGHNSLAPSNSGFAFAQKIRAQTLHGEPLYSVRMYNQTLPFYLQRTMTLVDYEDEMKLGIRQEPKDYIENLAAFEKIWQALPQSQGGVAIIPLEEYPLWFQKGLPMCVLASDTRRIAISRWGPCPNKNIQPALAAANLYSVPAHRAYFSSEP